MFDWPHNPQALVWSAWALCFLHTSVLSLFPLSPLLSIDVWADFIVPFQHKLVWTATVHIETLLCWPVGVSYTYIIMSRKHWKQKTARGANAIQSNKARAEWKDPGWRRSSLASVKEINKQNCIWRQLGPVFIYAESMQTLGNTCSQVCFNQKKHGRNSG